MLEGNVSCFPSPGKAPLSPQSKTLATLTPEFKKFLGLVIFVYNEWKNNAVPEPRTGHFRGHVGFEA